MDLLKLFGLFLRHKVVASLTIVAVVCLLVLAYLSSPPVYRVSGSVVLLNPPAPPPSQPPAAAPSTTVASASGSTTTSVLQVIPPPAFDNPYVRFDDVSVVVDILVRVIRSPAVTEDLVAEGLTGTYTIYANVNFQRGPIIDIAAEADSPESARASARLLLQELGEQLLRLQREQGTDPVFSIRAFTVVPPDKATTVFSSALRRLIAVGGVGAMTLVGSTMLAETVTTWRAARRTASRALTDTDLGSNTRRRQRRRDPRGAARPALDVPEASGATDDIPSDEGSTTLGGRP